MHSPRTSASALHRLSPSSAVGSTKSAFGQTQSVRKYKSALLHFARTTLASNKKSSSPARPGQSVWKNYLCAKAIVCSRNSRVEEPTDSSIGGNAAPAYKPGYAFTSKRYGPCRVRIISEREKCESPSAVCAARARSAIARFSECVKLLGHSCRASACSCASG